MENSDLRVNWDDTEDVGIITHYKGTPFTGICFSLHENGKLKEEVGMVDGLKHGKQICYSENGQIDSEFQNKNDELDSGVSKTYYENGNLKTEISFKDGDTHILLKKTYFENGKLESEGGLKYDERRKLTLKNGVWKTYLENGQIQVEGEYKDDKKHGKIIFYNKKTNPMDKGLGFGTPQQIEFYKDDILDGPLMRYDDDGYYIDTTMYKNGEIEFTTTEK